MINGNIGHFFLFQKISDFFRPFDESHNARLAEVVFDADGDEFVFILQAVRVDVHEGGNVGVFWNGVDIHEGEGGAGHRFGHAERFGQAFDERCLARAEVTVQGDNHSARESLRQGSRDFLCFGF